MDNIGLFVVYSTPILLYLLFILFLYKLFRKNDIKSFSNRQAYNTKEYATWVFDGEKFVCNKCKQEALFYKESKEELGELSNYCPYCGKPMWQNSLIWEGKRDRNK